MPAKLITRGALLGAAILPAYWLVSMPTINESLFAPALLGVGLLGLGGAIAGYCWSNVAGIFDFTLPEFFLTRSSGAEEASSSSDIGSVGLGHPKVSGTFGSRRWDDRRWDDYESKERFIFSGDWRDEYSSPSSREEDDRRSGLL